MIVALYSGCKKTLRVHLQEREGSRGKRHHQSNDLKGRIQWRYASDAEGSQHAIGDHATPRLPDADAHRAGPARMAVRYQPTVFFSLRSAILNIVVAFGRLMLKWSQWWSINPGGNFTRFFLYEYCVFLEYGWHLFAYLRDSLQTMIRKIKYSGGTISYVVSHMNHKQKKEFWWLHGEIMLPASDN